MSRFIYLNKSPDGENKNDCVSRAITLASGIEYPLVRKKLFHTARLLGCEKLCWSCYSFFLTQVLGYRQVNCDGMSVGSFADLHPKGTYLIRIDQHLTTVINGDSYDTFDCRHRKCHIAWEIL